MHTDRRPRRHAAVIVAAIAATLITIGGASAAQAKRPDPTPPPAPTPTQLYVYWYRAPNGQTVHLYALLHAQTGWYVNGEPVTFSYQATAATPEAVICTDTTHDGYIPSWGPGLDEHGLAQCEVSAAEFADAAARGFVARFAGDATYGPSQGTFSAAQLAGAIVSSHLPG
jgi:hypothetical protein